jgi:PAS domain S-box-containing protein
MGLVILQRKLYCSLRIGGTMPEDIILAQNSEKVLEYIDRHSGSCLVILDDQKFIRHCNQAFLNILGLQSVPIGKNLKDFLLQEVEELEDEAYRYEYSTVHLTLVSTMQIQFKMIGYILLLEDGYLLFCEKTWLAEDEIFHEISKINNQLANITRELNKKNIALEKTREIFSMQKERLTNIVEGANVGTWEWNVQTGETIFNEKWANIIGYTLEEISPVSIETWINNTHPDDMEDINSVMVRHVRGELDSYIVDYRMKHKKGHWAWVNSRGKVISRTKNGEPLWVFGTHIDITERKKAEEALRRQASERAAVDAFTSSVSHDLQAPLRRIKGFSEALLAECTGQLSDQASNYLKRITRQIDSMKDLTDGLLQLSRVVSQVIEIEEVNLSPLAVSHIEKLRCTEPSRWVETVVAPEMKAMADRDLLSIVLEKLLENAWKFTVRVENALIECGIAEEDGRTIFFVRDNGVGFDQQHSANLFSPFQKLHSEDHYPGIGIGLNLVYRIITRHGGEFWAEGEPGKGACFYFTLPS